MRFILPLAKISLCLSLFSSNMYSMTAITEELLRRRQASQVEALSKSQSNNATVIEEVVEERVSGVTDTDRDSLAARRSSFLDSIKAPSQLKKVVVEKDETPALNIAQELSSLRMVREGSDSQKRASISSDVISGLRGSLKASSGKPPASSTESVTLNPYANILKKTSGSAGLTSSDSMESVGFSSHKFASVPSKKTGAIQVKVPEADFSYIGNARIVKNKK